MSFYVTLIYGQQTQSLTMLCNNFLIWVLMFVSNLKIMVYLTKKLDQKTIISTFGQFDHLVILNKSIWTRRIEHKTIFLNSQIGKKGALTFKNSSILKYDNIYIFLNNKYLLTHLSMTYLPTMASYLPIHNKPLRYYTCTHINNIYIHIYIFHIIYVGKGDWTLVSLDSH